MNRYYWKYYLISDRLYRLLRDREESGKNWPLWLHCRVREFNPEYYY